MTESKFQIVNYMNQEGYINRRIQNTVKNFKSNLNFENNQFLEAISSDDITKLPNSEDQDLNQTTQEQIKFFNSLLQEIVCLCAEKIKEERLKLYTQEQNVHEAECKINSLSSENEALKQIIHNFANKIEKFEKLIEEGEIRIGETQIELISLKHERRVLINSLGSLQSLEDKLQEVAVQSKFCENIKEESKDQSINFQEEINDLQRCILEQNYQIETLKKTNQRLFVLEERNEESKLLIKDYESFLELLKNENEQLKQENQLLKENFDNKSKEFNILSGKFTKEENQEIEKEIDSFFVEILNKRFKIGNFDPKQNHARKIELSYLDTIPTKSTLDDTPRMSSLQNEASLNYLTAETKISDHPILTSIESQNLSNKADLYLDKNSKKQKDISKNNFIIERKKFQGQKKFDSSNELSESEKENKISSKTKNIIRINSFYSVIVLLIRVFLSCLFFPFGAVILIIKSIKPKSAAKVMSFLHG